MKVILEMEGFRKLIKIKHLHPTYEMPLHKLTQVGLIKDIIINPDTNIKLIFTYEGYDGHMGLPLYKYQTYLNN